MTNKVKKEVEKLFKKLVDSSDIWDVELSLWPSGCPRLRGRYRRKPNRDTHIYEGFWTYEDEDWKPSKAAW